MKKLILLLLFACGVSHAALTASVPYVWPTAAFLKLQGYSGTCTIVVSTDQAVEAMSTLNKVGLPRPQGITLLDLFAKSGLMSSTMEDTVRYQAGMAEQLKNTIRKIIR